MMWVVKILGLARTDACAIPVVGGEEVPFDRDQIVG